MKKIFAVSVLTLTLLLGANISYAEKPAQFTLNDLDGNKVSLSDFKGKKVFIDFFATWCPPCRKELKEINKILKEHPEGGNYKIICISVDDSADKVKSFMKKHNYTMTVLFDDKDVAASYGVTGIPALFLVDENGDLVWQQAGAIPGKKIKQLLGIE